MMQKATMMAPFFQSRLWVLNGMSLAEVTTASVGAVVMMVSFLDYDCGKETGGRNLWQRPPADREGRSRSVLGFRVVVLHGLVPGLVPVAHNAVEGLVFVGGVLDDGLDALVAVGVDAELGIGVDIGEEILLALSLLRSALRSRFIRSTSAR